MSLQNVLVDELRDLYSAENQLVKALPKMAKGAESEDLKEIFTSHLEETKGHVDRLKQIFEQFGQKPTGEHCKGMEGLVEEGSEAIEKDEEGATKDVLIAGAALRVEHYEIAGYTAAIAIARQLGHDEVVSLLTETLNEEEAAGKKVLSQANTSIAESSSEADEVEDDEEEKAPGTAKASTAATKKSAKTSNHGAR